MALPIEKQFPKLRLHGYRITSSEDQRYNCIAFAAGDQQRFWWPNGVKPYYWPAGFPLVETVENFVHVFESLGYESCESAELEPGFQKVAIYALGSAPKHAARQTAEGKWLSKLGPNVDIEHNTLDALTGLTYGAVARLLRRPITVATPPANKRGKKK